VSDSYDKFAGIDDNSDTEPDVFKMLFLSDNGQYVLGILLNSLEFMEKCESNDPIEIAKHTALNNKAIELLTLVYADRQQKKVNIHRIIEHVRNKLCRT